MIEKKNLNHLFIWGLANITRFFVLMGFFNQVQQCKIKNLKKQSDMIISPHRESKIRPEDGDIIVRLTHVMHGISKDDPCYLPIQKCIKQISVTKMATDGGDMQI